MPRTHSTRRISRCRSASRGVVGDRHEVLDLAHAVLGEEPGDQHVGVGEVELLGPGRHVRGQLERSRPGRRPGSRRTRSARRSAGSSTSRSCRWCRPARRVRRSPISPCSAIGRYPDSSCQSSAIIAVPSMPQGTQTRHSPGSRYRQGSTDLPLYGPTTSSSPEITQPQVGRDQRDGDGGDDEAVLGELPEARSGCRCGRRCRGRRRWRWRRRRWRCRRGRRRGPAPTTARAPWPSPPSAWTRSATMGLMVAT